MIESGSKPWGAGSIRGGECGMRLGRCGGFRVAGVVRKSKGRMTRRAGYEVVPEVEQLPRRITQYGQMTA